MNAGTAAGARLAAPHRRVMARRLRTAALVWIVAAASLFPGVAAGRGMPDLYQALVPISDRGDAAFARASAAALEQVLVKLTGNRRIARETNVGSLLGSAKNLLLQFAYRDAPDGGGLMLFAEFDETALARELDARGITLWAKERPDTIAWLIVDDGAARQLVGGDEPGRLGDVLLARARARGVPMLLPLMDVEESQHLIYAGDWDGVSTTAAALASRYGTPAVLIGYLRQTVPGFWDVRWRITVGSESFETRQEGDIPELLVEDGVDSLGDALARRFAAPGAAGSDRIAITVFGVASVSDYARATAYLESLDAVGNLFVRSVSGQSVTYELSARGGSSALAQGISFGQVLTPVPTRADAYQLLP